MVTNNQTIIRGEVMPTIYWDLDVILSDEDMTVLLTLEEFIDEID
jgi:hypothetical protein